MHDLRGRLPEREPYTLRDLDPVRGVTLHYTAGGTFQTAVDIANFQISPEAASHTGAGVPFPGIAYTILVTGDGVANICHDLNRRTWHSGAVINGVSRNETHVGICYTGNSQPNAAQIAGLAEAIGWCQDQLDRQLTIEGHRDAPYATDCPGPVWPQWKAAVELALQRPPTWAELVAQNGNITKQRDDWQAARRQLGQDPLSWPDFRAHEIALRAPDPGPRPAVGSDENVVPGPTWAELLAANEHITDQLNTWSAARRALGQDPFSWPDFQAHVMAIGGADPGSRPPNGFGA